MKIAAKSGVSLGQLLERKNKGATLLELHLNQGDVATSESIEKVFDNVKKAGIKVGVVHIPIDRKFTVEGILIGKVNYTIIKNTCKLANLIAEFNEEIVHVVMHQELSLTHLVDWGMYHHISVLIGILLNKYRNITINLENLSFINPEDDGLQVRSNHGSHNVELCRKLRSDLNTDRIGVVLDTCHALSTIRHLERYRELGIHEGINLRDYFTNSKGFLNVIHLSNARGFGHGDDHGAGFDTDEDVELLKEIINYVKDNDFRGILTLEVQEKDYLNCIVFEKLKSQLEMILEV